MANRGSELEVTTYSGRSMDANPLAGNVVDLCPVGALTSRDFRFNKRVWYLKPVPTISRHSAMANPIWADVDQNRVWRFRPRPQGAEGRHPLPASTTERYSLPPLRPGPRHPADQPAPQGRARHRRSSGPALRDAGPVAVVGQGTFGCDTAQRLGDLASAPDLRYGTGDLIEPIQFPALQPSSDGIFNRRGLQRAGLPLRPSGGAAGAGRERRGPGRGAAARRGILRPRPRTALLRRSSAAAPFSLVLEPFPGALEPGGHRPAAGGHLPGGERFRRQP